MIGASARPAAQSARQAVGETARIVGCDLFGDADLRATCDAIQILPMDRFPAISPADLTQLASDNSRLTTAWMYCGGIENAPNFIRDLASQHPLLGCSAEVVRAARDPVQVADCLRSAGLDYARVITTEHFDPSATSSQWIVKPLSSCAGHRIQAPSFDSNALSPARISTELSPANYAQQFIKGELQSASFVANGEAAVHLGSVRGYTMRDVIPSHPAATEQPYGYAGSTGILPLSDETQRAWKEIAKVLTGRFGLKGLFGIDAIVQPNGHIVPIEVNPRYTASMEVVEHALQRSLVRMHIDACVAGVLPKISGDAKEQDADQTKKQTSKQIIYARRPLTFAADNFANFLDGWRTHALRTGQEIDFADLPHFQSANDIRTFGSGQPVMTLLLQGDRFLAEWVPPAL